MKILVIGGNGYFGGKVVHALRTLPAAHVHIATRKPNAGDGDIKFDLNDAATFETLRTYDFVVNCSDSLVAQPDAAIAFCLAHGLSFVETTDDAQTVARLMKKFHTGETVVGRLFIGLGVMPGLSNLVAAELIRLVGADKVSRIEVAIKLNPLSGAGAGMSALSAQVASTLSKRYENGVLVTDPAVWFGAQVPFADGYATALRTGLPEALMLHASTGIPNTASYLSLSSPAIETALFGISLALPRDPFLKPLAKNALVQAFGGVRGVLFRNGKTPFEIVAMANRTDYFKHNGDSLSVKINDGMLGAAIAVSAGVQLIAQQTLGAGVYLPDQVLSFQDLIHEMRQQAGTRLNILVKHTVVS